MTQRLELLLTLMLGNLATTFLLEVTHIRFLLKIFLLNIDMIMSLHKLTDL